MSIALKEVSYIYMQHSPYETRAVDKISFEIKDRELFAIIGHTGSGKSTLVQTLNGLIRPSEGVIYVDGKDIWSKGFNLKELRFNVGLVFQYPEYQLFEETIFKDISYGPQKMNLSKDEVQRRVYETINMVGLSEDLLSRSPFEVSGGQKRRVAIAGILAMKPKYIVFDEPTAGLDPVGRRELLKMIQNLRDEYNMTVILISHSMEDVGAIADRVMVLKSGKVFLIDTPKNVFKQTKDLESIGLAVPVVTYLMQKLKAKGYDVQEDIISVEEAKLDLLRLYNNKENNSQ